MKFSFSLTSPNNTIMEFSLSSAQIKVISMTFLTLIVILLNNSVLSSSSGEKIPMVVIPAIFITIFFNSIVLRLIIILLIALSFSLTSTKPLQPNSPVDSYITLFLVLFTWPIALLDHELVQKYKLP